MGGTRVKIMVKISFKKYSHFTLIVRAIISIRHCIYFNEFSIRSQGSCKFLRFNNVCGMKLVI